ncbi:MAG: 2-amino-4-hydroxy-6-hydroxymethyldihydropteridine diphosphokinase [Gammaproteobacteria bacterium]|uniref:2-amino-4-hydroxy-6-hydroxymethyldihydropteridine diphosphokinase n=1 Tax=candidate division WWE3 bacterium TaxID=2053526 RepID=A0A928Y747_UNCKA|nr:2-amino-4-hydroxy-6-hydroxymethyldihydropteridine diphosphokinase [candidate division WWE3 bacterium]QOJ20800.1 MAG: 2-amino-4-hydroxy-6-hydroxymethyldihydropteridine diphosphokinase [Gammaproteobacteria bacterium]
MTKKPSQAFIALGSNLENPILQLQQAFDELAQLSGTRLIRRSSLYRSAPVGKLDQPDFINAVALIETLLAPHDLLKALLAIEQRHGRVREALNAPRTLDLDILLYDALHFQDADLTLPHPRMTQRAFVLMPLLEIAPECNIPGHGSIAPLLAACHEQKLERIKELL